MKKNKLKKRAMVLYYPIVLFVIIALALFTVNLSKNKPKNTEFTGQVFLDSYREVQESFNSAYYVQQSAGYSSYSALYPFAENGTYFDYPLCDHHLEQMQGVVGEYDQYIMWENVIKDKEVQCYPTENSITTNFALFLNMELNSHFKKYAPGVIPQDNYEISFDKNKMEITGIPIRNVVTKMGNITYSLKPSFKTQISYDFIERFTSQVKEIKGIKENIGDCLEKGSGEPDDDDLKTCTEFLTSLSLLARKYKVNPITAHKNYTLLFDIKDTSFNNPYSDEKLNIKLGIRFLDIFIPPSTEIIGIETRGIIFLDKYLTWKKNNASDVVSYTVYSKKIETGVGGAKTKKPTDTSKMDETANVGKIEWKIQGLNPGEYYFYIIAIDNADNKADSTSIEPTKLTI